MSSNNCNCVRCYNTLQDRMWTVRDAIAALKEYFDDEMPVESQLELGVIIANLHFRESELQRLISKMQREAAK